MNLNNFLRLISGFSVVGLLTTGLSILLLYIGLTVFSLPLLLTYITVYVLTIAFSFFLNSCFVFKATPTYTNSIFYLIIYLSGMLLGTILLSVAKLFLQIDNFVLSLLIIPITMNWNFFLTLKLFKSKKQC